MKVCERGVCVSFCIIMQIGVRYQTGLPVDNGSFMIIFCAPNLWFYPLRFLYWFSALYKHWPMGVVYFKGPFMCENFMKSARNCAMLLLDEKWDFAVLCRWKIGSVKLMVLLFIIYKAKEGFSVSVRTIRSVHTLFISFNENSARYGLILLCLEELCSIIRRLLM